MKNTTALTILLMTLACACGGSTAEDLCDNTDCGDHGSCVATDGAPGCACDPGYHDENLVCVANGSWQLDAGHYVPARMPIEIINPQPDLTIASRYYMCYPGLQWRVPISVLGGAWPFHYEVVAGPAGMTIGQDHGHDDYGILVWPNPVESGSPHAITVQVTDQDGTAVSVSWTLTVTTDGFLFVDAVSGDDGNDGSIGSPMQTMLGWLESGAGARNWDTYNNYQVYYYSGVYYTKWDYDTEWPNEGAQPMRQKPNIHLAYPGESPIFDFAGNGGSHPGGKLKFADAPANENDDIFFGGIHFRGACSQSSGDWQQGVALSQTSRLVVFENSFGEQAGPGVTGQNPAWFFFGRDTDPPQYVKRLLSFHNNQISDLEHYMLIESYDVEKMVLEGNSVSSSIGASNRLIYFKVASRHASVRNNTGVDDVDVWLAEIGSSQGDYDEIEIAWNNWRSRASDTRLIWVGIETTVPMGQIYIYRNTLTNGTVWLQASAGGGPVWFQDNVRQYGSGTDGISASSGSGTEPLFTWEGQDTDLTATAGLVDPSSNALIDPHRATYLGQKGHEVR